MRRIGLLLVVALIATACAGGEAQDPAQTELPDDPAGLAEVLASDFGDDNVAAAVEVLSRLGIAVYDDEVTDVVQEVEGEQSPLRFMQYQAGKMAQETAASSGFAGSELDELAEIDHKFPQFSYLVAGYVANVDTFGAEVSRALMEGQDLESPETAVFPTIALVAFLSDMFAGSEGQAQLPSQKRIVLAAGNGPVVLGQGICGKVRDFFNETMNSIRDAARSFVGDGIFGAIIDFVGGIVAGIAKRVLATLIDNIPFISQLKRGLGILGALIAVSTAIKPWQVQLETEPAAAHYQVGGAAPVEGEFVATVVTEGDPFPPSIRACADLAGISLPQREEVPGSPMQWETIAGIPTHAKETAKDDRVRDDETARFAFRMSTETDSAHESGDEQSGTAVVKAIVKREDVDLLKSLGDSIFGGGLGGLVGQIIGRTLAQEANEALTEILGLSEANGTGTLAATYHTPTAAQARLVVPGTGGGRIDLNAYSCEGARGVWQGTAVISGAGNGRANITWDLTGGGPARLNWSMNLQGIPVATTFTWSGTVTILRAGGRDRLKFQGTSTVTTPYGGGSSSDRGVVPIKLGNVPDCA